jgi:glycosyltransferase involved in cell wall biosynthesis
VQGLAMIADVPWTLTIAGAVDRSPDTARELREAIEKSGLSGRVSLVGELSDAALAEAYASADIFVMPSLFEGYGMVITEALARGLPIVSTTGGALVDVVPAEAALLVPSGDAAALANALKTMILDVSLRGSKAASAWNLSVDLPRWPQTTAVIACALKDALA